MSTPDVAVPLPPPGALAGPVTAFLGGGTSWDDPLPTGAQVTVLLGEGTGIARGRRVVRGRVVGYTERPMGALDVQLEDVTTWLQGAAPQQIEVLGPEVQPLLRVALLQSVAETAAILTGESGAARGLLSAVEVPYQMCWPCKLPLGTIGGVTPGAPVTPDLYCRHCGRRAHLGRPDGWPTHPTSAGSEACPVCWCPHAGTDRFCPGCGVDRTLPERLAAWVHRPLPMEVCADHRRRARAEAEVVAWAWGRRGLVGTPQLVAQITRVQVQSGHQTNARVARAPHPTDTFVVAVPCDARAGQALLADLEAGRALQVTEVARACPTCAEHHPTDQLPRLLGRYCPQCGTRVRLMPHPQWQQRWPRGTAESVVVRHECGTPVHVGGPPCCSGCGDPIDTRLAQGAQRFARLVLDDDTGP